LKGKTIADILEMTVDEASVFFADGSKLLEKLQLLKTLGLSYLKLGQNSQTFSGGEAQRIKIAYELLNSNPTAKQKLYIFDEASRGLHQSDLIFLLQTFQEILKQKHTIIAIEHNPDVIKKAQYISELHDGRLVFEGTLSELKEAKNSLTSKYL